MLFDRTDRSFDPSVLVRIRHLGSSDFLVERDFSIEEKDIRGLDGESKGLHEITVRGKLRQSQVRMWWPNGEGEQNLYQLTVTLRDQQSGKDLTEKTVQVRPR